MIEIIEVKLSPDDRRILAQAATKAALAAGMSLKQWQRQREDNPIAADLVITMGSRQASPAHAASGEPPAGAVHDSR